MTVETLRSNRQALIDDSIENARTGTPRVLNIIGTSGMGKSTHLRHAIRRATGFRVLEACGEASGYRPPYEILRQLGVEQTETSQGRPLTPTVAAQGLRRLIDEESSRGPVLIAIDDAQWADTESMDSLYWLVQRLGGDRLLVIVANRPLGAHQHVAWQRLLARSPNATSIALEGINLTEAAGILADAVSSATVAPDAGLIDRLHRHTGGNPLYLRSLVRQYSLNELRAARELPAPVEAARDLQERLEILDADAAAMIRAIAVTSSSWVEPSVAATVAGITGTALPLELLAANGLLATRSRDPQAPVRIVHSLIRAAIYQSIPAALRRELHHRAGAALTSPMARLEHEVAAAEGADPALAARLEAAARTAHFEADYSRSAQLLRWASAVCSDGEERERTWLESLFETVLARDVTAVRQELNEVSWAADAARRTLVMGMLFVTEMRVAEARRVFLTLSPQALEDTDGNTRSRINVLLSWVLLVSGYPTAEVRAVVDRVNDDGDLDPAVRSLYARVAGQIAGRDFDVDHLQADFDAVPLDAHTTPISDTGRLGWRGSIYAMCGFASEARRDLSEVVARIRAGATDSADGVDHGLYAFALWQDGELDRASIELQAGEQTSLDRVHPLIQALRPLIPAVRGEADRAGELLVEAESTLLDLPWKEAVAVLSQAQIVQLHANGTEASRAAFLPRFRANFGGTADAATRGDGAIWQLHMALARIWAGEGDAVESHLTAIEIDMIVPEWAAWARPWVMGLAAEAAGNPDSAHRHLAAAAGRLNRELPLYRAHVLVDLARLAGVVGDSAGSERWSKAANEIYTAIGATPYADRLASRFETVPPVMDVLACLSEREREVATLVIAGLSYAQVAQDLYVTRSTVGFHLGNVYAKTGVSGRHALIDLVRSEK